MAASGGDSQKKSEGKKAKRQIAALVRLCGLLLVKAKCRQIEGKVQAVLYDEKTSLKITLSAYFPPSPTGHTAILNGMGRA